MEELTEQQRKDLGKRVAEQLRDLGQRGILIVAAEEGQITRLECDADECHCPHGANYFEPRPDHVIYWAPSVDHVIEKSAGGKLTLDNVRLTHVLCNRVQHAKRHGKPHDKDLENARSAVAQSAFFSYVCERCSQLIPHGDGLVYLLHSELEEAKILRQEKVQRDQIVEEAERALGRKRIPIDWDSLFSIQSAKWHVTHSECRDPGHANEIPLDEMRTPRDVLEWTVHLLGKNWFHLTSWRTLVEGLLHPPPSGGPLGSRPIP